MSSRTYGIHHSNGPSHWGLAIVHFAAQFWVRTQLQLASAITVSAVLIYLGLGDRPKALPPIATIVANNPLPSIGLAIVFLVVSVLAFILARSRGPSDAAAQEGDTPMPAYLRNRLALIGLLVLMIVSLALGGLGIGLVIKSAGALRQEPVNIVKAFCGDVAHQHYTEAYGLLSTSYQAKVPQQQFQQVSELLDHVNGNVTTCGAAHGGAGADVGNTIAHVPTYLLRLNTPQISATIRLVRELNTWRIENPEALQDTDVAPLAVAANFCTDLTSRDYGEAYTLTSAGYQSGAGTVDQWIRAFAEVGSSTGHTVFFSRCDVDYSSYKLTAADQATVLITVTISVIDETTGKEIYSDASTDLFTIIRQQGAWVVDTME